MKLSTRWIVEISCTRLLDGRETYDRFEKFAFEYLYEDVGNGSEEDAVTERANEIIKAEYDGDCGVWIIESIREDENF